MVCEAKEIIHELYNDLPQNGMNDLKEVLLKVYRKLETNPENPPLINRLVNYIYVTSVTHKLTFTPAQDDLIRHLSKIGQVAGVNGVYRSSYGDKSQF